MALNNPLLVFTDLDGTLLDHHTYSWAAAEQALAMLREKHIPVIINSSKTLAEVVALQQCLAITGPIIFENGGGIAMPAGSCDETDEFVREGDFCLHSFTCRYPEVRRQLLDLRQAGFRFTGFGDMDVGQICDATGLDAASAASAKRRYFDEPILWQDTAARLAQFTDALAQRGLAHLYGGRFLHVMGPVDKGMAMRWYVGRFTPDARTIALGDGENDLAMLAAADIAVLVRSPAHALPVLAANRQPANFRITDEYGPAGWNRAVLQIIEELGCG